DADRIIGQLALLSDRHKASRKLMRHRPAQDEATRFNAGNLVDLLTRIWVYELVDCPPERTGIPKQRRDVPELNARLWVVWDRTQDGEERFLYGCRHRRFPRLPDMIALNGGKRKGRQLPPRS